MNGVAQSVANLCRLAQSGRGATTIATALAVAIVVTALGSSWHERTPSEDAVRVDTADVQAAVANAPGRSVSPDRDSSTNAARSPQMRELETLVDRLREDQRRFERRLGELERRYESAAMARSTAETSNARPPTREEFKLDQEAAVIDIDDWLASETPDPQWQRDVEHDLHASTRDADGVTLVDIECGATLCRAQVQYADSAAANEFEERVLDAPVAAGGAQIIPTTIEGGPLSALLYFVREGHGFPDTLNR